MTITAISPLVALAAIVLSGLSLALMIARLGRDDFPPALFRASCSLGVVMANLIIVAEAPFSLQTGVFAHPPLVTAFGLAGFPEEAVKFAAVIFFLRPHYLCRTPRAFVLGGAAVGLGFALTEDFLYIVAAGAQWGAVATGRALTAVPMHVFIGAIAGFACARGSEDVTPIRAWSRIAPAYLIAALLHGLYDLPQLTARAKPPYPKWVVDFAGLVGVDQPTLLNSVLLAATLCIACIGFLLFRAIDGAPVAQAEARPAARWRRRFARVALARATAWLIGGLFLLGSLAFVAIAAVLSFISAQAGPLVAGVLYAVFPLAIALTLLRRRRPVVSVGSGAVSGPIWRRPSFAAAAALAALAMVAAYHWGETPARNLFAARINFEGVKAAARGDLEEAIRLYDRALALNPENVDSLSKRAGANEILHRYDSAVADLDVARRLQPNNIGLLLQSAEVRDQMHASAEGLADLDRAMALSPNEPDIWAARALQEADSGDTAKANADSAHALALNPRNRSALMTQADLMARAGDYDGARRNLDKVLTTNPADVDASFNRGQLRLYQRDAAGAAEDLLRANAILVTPYPAMWLFLVRQRMKVEGRELLAAQTKHWPVSAWPYPVIQQLLGKMPAAEARAAASDDDQRCEADFYNGELLLNAGATDEAIATFNVAIGECPLGFIERQGAAAELHALGRPLANSEAKSGPSPAPAQTNEAVNGPPAGAAPLIEEPQIATGASQADDRDGSAVAGATVSAEQQYSGTAVWSFVEKGDGSGELDVVLMFGDAPIHGELSLRRVTVRNEPRYWLQFIVTAEDRTQPPFSALGVMLSTPQVQWHGTTYVSSAIGELTRTNDTNFRLTISPDEAQRFLTQLTKGDAVTMNLAAYTDTKLSLELALDAKTARVAQIAADSWR